jgi:hypothetical protein
MRSDIGQRAVKGYHRTSVQIVLVAIAITIALYGRSLALPFYSDDLVQIPWLRDLSFGDLWRQVSPYGYYRPLAFSAWLLIRSNSGLEWTPAVLRLMNLVMHAVASSLVGWLALEIDPDRKSLGAVFAAMLFAAYPFAYQAVPWVSALFYPMVTALMVLSVIGYLRFRRDGSRRWLAVSLVAAVLAPFAHENGVLIGGLIVLAEVFGRTSTVERRFKWSLWPLAHLAISAAYLALWFSMREGGVSTLDLSPGGVFQNATILSTGLSYPVVWIAARAEHTPSLQTVLVWGIALASAGLLVWLVRRSQRVAWFCAGWFVLCIGPVLVTMRPDWLIDAPRFLYPAGVGAALWWGIAISRLAGEQRREQLLAMGLAGIVAMPGAVFAYQGVGWHLRGGRAIWDAIGITGQGTNGSLIVNLPERLAPQHSLYPYFDGGAILLPPQIEVWEIFRTNQRGLWESTVVSIGSILPPVPYRLTTYGPALNPDRLNEAFDKEEIIAITDYSMLPTRTRFVGARNDQYGGNDPPVAVFGNELALWSTDARTWERDVVTVNLFWEVKSEMEGLPTVFVHLVDATGKIIAQGDGDPMGGLHPLSIWYGAPYFLEDHRYIHIPSGVSRDGLMIYVGVWTPSTGEKLPISGGNFPDNRVPIPVGRRFYY